MCDFPARAMILNEMGLFINSGFDHCIKYLELKNKLNLRVVSLVFSSYFIEKPASAFGHTFFKLRSYDSTSEDNDLLDYGADFSATVTTPNPILYGIMGIFGGFDGNFKLMPYYYKIREYNDMESRDLWNYELAFDKRDLELFVAHLFEMQKASFDYYYTGENCSYHILGFVNAIRPDWKLMDQLNTFVPPIETIYALYESQNIVTKVAYRSSLNKKVLQRYNHLNQLERKYFFQVTSDDNFNELEKIDDPFTKSNVTEMASDYYDFKNAPILLGEKNDSYNQAMKKKFQINLIRSKIKEKPFQINQDTELKNAPHLGHKTRRLKIGYLNENSFKGFELQYKFSLHEYLDRQTGWIPFSKTEMGRLDFRYVEKNRPRLDKFSLVGIDALKPIGRLSIPLSWRFATGVMDQRFIPRQDVSPYFDLALGVSSQFKYFAYAIFLRADQSLIFNYAKHYRMKLGPELLLVFNNEIFAASFEVNRLKILNQLDRYVTNIIAQLHYNSGDNFGFFLKDEKIDNMENAYSVGVIKYF